MIFNLAITLVESFSGVKRASERGEILRPGTVDFVLYDARCNDVVTVVTVEVAFKYSTTHQGLQFSYWHLLFERLQVPAR